MQTRVQKWGNSLAIRIPKAFATETQLTEGVTVEMSIEEGHLVIAPSVFTPTLEELLAQITPENVHTEVDWGKMSDRKCGDAATLYAGTWRFDLADL